MRGFVFLVAFGVLTFSEGTLLAVERRADGQCPETHPNVYYNGQYCCQSNKEKVYTPQGDKCDGSAIEKTSLCCEGDKFVKCPSGICDSFPDCQKDDDPTGVKYRGTVATTVSGRKCQRWDSQAPNQHTRTAANYPNFGLGENYCRNPDGEAGAWCYNNEGVTPRWEYCDIPKCTEKDAEGWVRNEGKYLGGYSSGVAKYDTLKQALGECANRNDCGGVTFEQGSKKYTLRKGSDLKASPSKEISWQTMKADGCWDAEDRAAMKSGYRGTQSTTELGYTCQKWTSQSPHEHTYTVANYPEKGVGDHNYCRNPAEKYDKTWCYTTNPAKRWDWCVVPTCDDCQKDDDPTGVKYRGTVATTVSGRKCQRWDSQAPNEHTRTAANYPNFGLGENYCRNPDGEAGAWCYNNEGVTPRWEYCDIPKCTEKDAEGWVRNEGKYLGGYSAGVAKYDTLKQALGQCPNRNDCGGVTYEQGSKKYTLRRGADLRTSPSREISWKIKPKLTAAWDQIPGGLTRISKGKSGVWGVNRNGNIYNLNADGRSWTQIAGGLVQVASGAEVWGVNSGDAIWKYLGNNKWQNMPGRLTNVAVSDDGNVWGVNRQQDIYRWLGSSWQHIAGKAIQVSVGLSGVWMVNAANLIYYRDGTRGDLHVAGTKWVLVPGRLKWIASGRDIVVGVNAHNDIYFRDGISNIAPRGTRWVKLDGKLSQIDVFDDAVVGTNPGYNIYTTPYEAPSTPVLTGQKNAPLKGLQVGERVSFSAIYSKSSSRFGFNIRDKAGNFLFRLAFRQATDPSGDGPISVLNSRLNNNWQGELRAPFPQFEEGKEFSITIVVLENRYICYFNGVLMKGINFPHRQNKANAVALDLWGGAAMGTNGVPIMWNRIMKKHIAGQRNAPLDGLTVGDKVALSAIYSETSARFGFNIKDKAGNYLFRLAFRQATDPAGDGPTSVMNSRVSGQWGAELRAPFPKFEDGKEFSIIIFVLEDKYVCSFNGEPMEGVEFPHRQDITTAAEFELWGGAAMGTNGVPIMWNKIAKEVTENLEDNWFEMHPPVGFKGAGGGIWTIGDKTVQAGTDGDIPIPADYFNEGKKRLAVFRPSNGNWYIKGPGYSDWAASTGNVVIQTGTRGDIPVPGDYKGDCKTSIAVFRPSNGNWYIKGPGNTNWGDTTGNIAVQCGTNGDVPVAMDYFNERKLRIAVWRPRNGFWYIKGPGLANWGASSGNIWIQCGTTGDIPVPGDYYGDGTIRLAVWRPSNGNWYIKGPGNNNWGQSSGNKVIQCGTNGDIPVPADYFNEGKLRIAVFRPSNGKLYIKGNNMESWGSSEGNIVYPAEGSLPSQTVVSLWSIPKKEVEEEEDEDEEVNILSQDGIVVSQRDIAHDGKPERAIDGNTNGMWGSKTCTHTAGSSGNWWKAELGETYKINKVVLYNRMDCCSNRLNRARVLVGPVVCGEVTFKAGQAKYEIECPGAVGRRIKIVQPYNILTLCEVEAYGEVTDEKPLRDVARGMPTWQSTVGHGGVASRAVDGKTNGLWAKGTCTHSLTSNYNQWRVDLLDQYDVNSVLIYNRLDCCQERINGAKVYVGETLCGSVEWAAGKSVFQVNCDGATGSKVRITQDGQFLTLCEVQVLAKPSEDLGPLINIAEDGEATQSSVGWGGVADRAIDGNINMEYSKESCSHTGNANNGWWNLEFPEPVHVAKVVIYNRKDCCSERIHLAEVYADDFLCGKVRYEERIQVYKVGCNSDLVENVIAKNIKIKAADKQFLTLCEVKVLSDPTVEVGDDHLVNLAYNKPTSQSSTAHGGVSERAVDGKESGQWAKGTCTHTNGAGWWMVDMKDNYIVEKVWIKNRIDCCSTRIDGVKVYVGDQLCGTITYNPIKYGYTVECGEEGHGVVGQTVKIVNEKTFLTLCEVKVWGPKDPINEGMEDEEEVLGDKSEAKDDAISTASCPVGKVVSYCEVQTGNVGKNSDGALVKSQGAVCVAHNGWGGQGVVARALCTEEEQIGDPCNGPKLMKFKYLYNRGRPNPSAECPAGYEPLVCNAHSFWVGKLANKGITDTGVIPNERACAITDCTDANWCDVSLVCKLMEDLDAYAATVCPDCGGWHCGEGEECQMVDSEDESGERSPTCVEKQTGCDVDRCGDHGECEPVGTDDYTCECEDGYEFDERAGTCMPKHSKYDTVYGEPAIGDDATSFASCEVGQKVMRCHTFGAPGAADGVTITTTDGIVRCEARASHSKKFPIMAVAYCGDDNPVTDPCTQDEIHGIEYRIHVDNSPTVSCPGGYVMESCIFHSPWSQLLTDANRARITSIGSIDINDDGTCSIENCLNNPGHRWCKLTAVCKKLTGSEYLKAACPTCDDVRCPEEQECKMAHDLPTCVPRIPGGCEVDKCGKGECVEDGPNYECLCDDGYVFDETTCTDVDECAEEPCGNGECTNTEGSYECDCNKGYELVHGSCEDINECLDDPCEDTERCSNVEGSFICDCLDTFVKDKKTKECVCADGYENKDGECVDINECDDDPCGENEVCTNEVGNYLCECAEGAERDPEDVCQTFKHVECDIKPKKKKVKGFKGTNVNVKLKGEKKKVFKKYAKITWTKNGQPWRPKDDGKDKLNGFVIRKFDADDVGIYHGSIYIDEKGEISVCDVEVETELVEGSVKLKIDNEADLMKPQKAGKTLKIKCDLDLDNVKLDDPKSPDNVNWYKVTEDGDELLDDTDTIAIERAKGTYQLIFKDPTTEDSGTYRCEFDQQGFEVSTDVTIEVV